MCVLLVVLVMVSSKYCSHFEKHAMINEKMPFSSEHVCPTNNLQNQLKQKQQTCKKQKKSNKYNKQKQKHMYLPITNRNFRSQKILSQNCMFILRNTVSRSRDHKQKQNKNRNNEATTTTKESKTRKRTNNANKHRNSSVCSDGKQLTILKKQRNNSVFSYENN